MVDDRFVYIYIYVYVYIYIYIYIYKLQATSISTLFLLRRVSNPEYLISTIYITHCAIIAVTREGFRSKVPVV